MDGDPETLAAQWQSRLALWEESAPRSLPVRSLLTETGMDTEALSLLMTIGLIEEDPRFGAVFEWAQPGSPAQQRPTLGLLTAWWRSHDDCSRVRAILRHLRQLGLIGVVNPEAPRIQWTLEANSLAWDVLRGELLASTATWLQFHPLEDLPSLSSLV